LNIEKDLASLYLQSTEKAEITKGFQYYHSVDSVIANLRFAFLNFNDRLRLSDSINYIYDNAITEAVKLSEKDSDFLKEVYFFSEKSKAFSLYAHLKINEIEQLGSLPQGLVQRQHELENQLSYYGNQQALATTNNDQRSIARYSEKIQKSNEEREQLAKSLRSSNIDKYELIHNARIVNIKDVQRKMSDDQVILSYNMGKESTDVICILPDNAYVKSIGKTAELEERLHAYIALLTIPDLSEEQLQEYKEQSFELYKMLIGKVSLEKTVKDILIIPDNQLYFLPFESLISTAQGTAFGELDYLIKTFEIRYTQSLTMLEFLEQQQQRNDTTALNVLALAPNFDDGSAMPLLSSVERSAVGAIPNTQKEVNAISNYFETKILSQEQATERQFKDLYAKYQIIHLATHGLVNDQAPLESKILFHPIVNDSTEDGKLHSREILNLELDAEMVVLSACNTGVGEINRGEGAVSLASSFFYSGARSVVMSQWPANDLSTSRIMGSFYQFLNEGYTKSAALRQAKLDFLQNEKAVLQHPYYWSQFVIHGKNDALRSDSDYWKWGIAIISLVFLVGIVLFLKRR
ncbi:MAG: CHAT domain-containing protein, partial [Bacteroidota bacterium]